MVTGETVVAVVAILLFDEGFAVSVASVDVSDSVELSADFAVTVVVSRF